MAQGHCGYFELPHPPCPLHLSPRFSTGHRDIRRQRPRRRFQSGELVGETQIHQAFYARNHRNDDYDMGTRVSNRVTNHARDSRFESTKSTTLGVVLWKTHYIFHSPFLFTVPKYCIMFALLSRGFPTSPAIGDFENPIFDVEVSDVEKRRCTVSRSR